ncbi:hypothetical protein D3C84_989040 [compost metagenome]
MILTGGSAPLMGGVQGHQQDPLRPQVNGGAQRAQLVDGAVTVEALADGGGRKDEGQGR